MSQSQEDITALFQRYLEVCNEAMNEHKDEFPYNHIWEAAEKMQSESGVHFTIYDDEPKGDYQLKVANKHIELIDTKSSAATSSADNLSPEWRLNTSYMKEVIAHPEDYVKDPAKLDWLWLKRG